MKTLELSAWCHDVGTDILHTNPCFWRKRTYTALLSSPTVDWYGHLVRWRNVGSALKDLRLAISDYCLLHYCPFKCSHTVVYFTVWNGDCKFWRWCKISSFCSYRVKQVIIALRQTLLRKNCRAFSNGKAMLAFANTRQYISLMKITQLMS